jgi:oxygen-independent coproporphyrinogen-3 oxidase
VRRQLLGAVRTVYIGGGTPSFIGHDQIVRLAFALSTALTLGQDSEFTVEANPDSLTKAMVRDLYSLGVNRFSLGVQSFCDAELGALGRRHSARQAQEAVAMVQKRCDNVSLDLMCGIPLQTAASWQKSLETAVACEPSHISVYPLSVEEGTPLHASLLVSPDNLPTAPGDDGKQARSRRAPSTLANEDEQTALPSALANEDEQADMMLAAASTLARAGFKRYEIASYAQPGYECRHNIAYWSGLPYLGLGSAAASMRNIGGRRQRFFSGSLVEELDCRERALEDLMLTLRISRGASQELLAFACDREPKLPGVIRELSEQGLLEQTETGLALSKRGWLLGNLVFAAIWGAGE